MVCLWPGLPQLWMRGAWSGLALAVGFTALVNVLLMASLVWTEWFQFGLLLACWAAVIGLYIASAFVSIGWLGAIQPQAGVDDGEELFREAQTQYLKGNWFEAETLLNQRVSRNLHDADAQLMLASLKRHTGRLDDALAQLERLERTEAALKWSQEIANERLLLARARAEQSAETEQTGRQSVEKSAAKGEPAPQRINQELSEAA